MAAQAAREGRFLGGRPPYGYRLADAGPHPNPAKAADGRRSTGSSPTRSPPRRRTDLRRVPRRNGPLRDRGGAHPRRVPSPSAHDPARNPHRTARLVQVRGPGHPDEPPLHGPPGLEPAAQGRVLLDVDDVALGHETKLRWNDRADWIWSAEATHDAIVTAETFARVASRWPRA